MDSPYAWAHADPLILAEAFPMLLFNEACFVVKCMVGSSWWLLQILVMSSHIAVCERVCYGLQRPAMSAVCLRSEEGLKLAQGSSSLWCLALGVGEMCFAWFALIECT